MTCKTELTCAAAADLVDWLLDALQNDDDINVRRKRGNVKDRTLNQQIRDVLFIMLLAVDIFVVCADGLDSTIEVIAFNAVMWCHNISTTTGHLHPLVLGVKTVATYRGIMAS